MSLPVITPAQARALLDRGAILVDLREPDEYARERIAEARNFPLSKIDEADPDFHRGRIAIFHCRSGARTLANAAKLHQKFAEDCQAYILEGGLDTWKNAGLPVVVDRRQPLELQRQVQMGAGSLVLMGTLLGVFVSPWFLVLPAFAGAGLINAGLTGFCGMARILMKAPWNRAVYTPQRRAA